MDIVVENGVPQFISNELYERVQMRRKRNKRAPAASTATDEYLLTTKFYCGYCGATMVGESGRSQTGKKYYYYKCSNHKRSGGCRQRTLRKEVVERLVIDRAIEILHRDDVIEQVAERAAALQTQESLLLPALTAQLEETELGINNLLDAIQMGIITASTRDRLESLEIEKKKLEAAILAEKLEHPNIPKEHFADWLRRMKNGSIDDKKYRKMVANVLINSVYLCTDGITFGLNFIDGVETIPLRQWEQAQSSVSVDFGRPTRKARYIAEMPIYRAFSCPVGNAAAPWGGRFSRIFRYINMCCVVKMW